MKKCIAKNKPPIYCFINYNISNIDNKKMLCYATKLFCNVNRILIMGTDRTNHRLTQPTQNQAKGEKAYAECENDGILDIPTSINQRMETKWLLHKKLSIVLCGISDDM